MATLDQKVALVTGAASGIGFAIARCYLQEGARVMMAEVDGQRLEDAARSLGCRDQLQALRADVSSAEVWQRAADQVEQTFGGLDILVNNAWIEVAGTPAHPRQSTRNSNHAPLVARTTGDGCVARTT